LPPITLLRSTTVIRNRAPRLAPNYLGLQTRSPIFCAGSTAIGRTNSIARPSRPWVKRGFARIGRGSESPILDVPFYNQPAARRAIHPRPPTLFVPWHRTIASYYRLGLLNRPLLVRRVSNRHGQHNLNLGSSSCRRGCRLVMGIACGLPWALEMHVDGFSRLRPLATALGTRETASMGTGQAGVLRRNSVQEPRFYGPD